MRWIDVMGKEYLRQLVLNQKPIACAKVTNVANRVCGRAMMRYRRNSICVEGMLVLCWADFGKTRPRVGGGNDWKGGKRMEIRTAV